MPQSRKHGKTPCYGVVSKCILAVIEDFMNCQNLQQGMNPVLPNGPVIYILGSWKLTKNL